MLEIEVKCPVANFAPILAQLQNWNAKADASLDEADHYFNAPDRDFAQTDEALRIRRIGVVNRVTYKGPKQPGPTKTRKEIEVRLADGQQVAEEFGRLLESLGYRPTAVVRKRRTEYRFQRSGFELAICLDDVDQVGRFVEAEIVADEERKAAADDVLRNVCAELHLTDFERRSYLEMLLEKLGRR